MPYFSVGADGLSSKQLETLDKLMFRVSRSIFLARSTDMKVWRGGGGVMEMEGAPLYFYFGYRLFSVTVCCI